MLLALGVASDPARAEGPGIKIGESLVLHPGVDLITGYDTNVFYASDTKADIAQGAFTIAVTPALDLATRPPQRDRDASHTVDFRLHVGLPLRFLLSPSSDVAARNDVNQHYSVGADVSALLAILPFAQWSFDLFENFLQTSLPPYSVVKDAFTLDFAHNINASQNQLGARLKWRPGGQRFETSLQYTFGLYMFETTSGLVAKNSLINDFVLRMRWNFFPKTALYIGAQETINTYNNQGFTNTPPTSLPFRVVAGILGLITPKLSLDVNIGYGNSFTQSSVDPFTMAKIVNASYSSVVGLVDLTWKPTLTTAIGLGYRHDFAPALIGTFYDNDAGFLSFSQLLWRFSASLRGTAEQRRYHGSLAADGLLDNRVDTILTLHAELNYPIRDYLILGIGDDLIKNFSNCSFKVAGPPCSYLRDEVWLRLAFSY